MTPDFGDDVRDRIALIDEVLASLDQPDVFSNADFTLDVGSSGFNVASFHIRAVLRPNSAAMWLEVGPHIRLDIENAPEMNEWAGKEIALAREQVFDEIRAIFTAFIVLERKSEGKFFFEFFDQSGHFLRWASMNDNLHSLTGLHVANIATKRQLYFPLYLDPGSAAPLELVS